MLSVDSMVAALVWAAATVATTMVPSVSALGSVGAALSMVEVFMEFVVPLVMAVERRSHKKKKKKVNLLCFRITYKKSH